MDEEITKALESDRLIDITTTGRKSGDQRRIEIGFTYLDGEPFIAGMPGPRSWFANLNGNPEFTFHLKQSIERDIPATAIPVRDEARKREIFSKFAARRRPDRPLDVDQWVNESPLVQIELHA